MRNLIKREAGDKSKGFLLQRLRAALLFFNNADSNPNISVATEYESDIYLNNGKIYYEETKNVESKSLTFSSHEVLNTMVYFIDIWLKNDKNNSILFGFYSTSDIGIEYNTERTKRLSISFPKKENKQIPILKLLINKDFKSNNLINTVKSLIIDEYLNQYYNKEGKGFYQQVQDLTEGEWIIFLERIKWMFNDKSIDEIDTVLRKKIKEYSLFKELNMSSLKEDFIISNFLYQLDKRQSKENYLNHFVNKDIIDNIFLKLQVKNEAENQLHIKNLHDYIMNEESSADFKLPVSYDDKSNFMHFLKMDKADINKIEETLFSTMLDGNVILLIGPGIFTHEEKPFYTDEIINKFSEREDIKHEDFSDITDFVNNIFYDNYSRADFDSFISEYFRNMEIPEVLKIISTIKWREIITTNPDNYLETVYELKKGNQQDLVPIRNSKSLRYNPLYSELRYVKLNGCISSLDAYPIIFSTEDIKRTMRYFLNACSTLITHSPIVKIIAIGFSLNEKYSSELFSKIEKIDQRNNKRIYLLDQHIQTSRLSYLKNARNISVLKISSILFFEYYKRWEQDKIKLINERRSISFKDHDNRKINLPSYVIPKIGDNIIQLKDDFSNYIEPKEFYKGKEPNYFVIRKNYDVIKVDQISVIKKNLLEMLENKPNIKVPLVFLSGSYGTGKSTFTYRLIHSLLHDKNQAILAFEIYDPDKIDIKALLELFNQTTCRNFIFTISSLEQDSSFKSVINFQNKLSNEILPDINVLILSSIRSYALAKYKKEKRFEKCYIDIDIDSSFTKTEATLLVEKLFHQNLINYRDLNEKNNIIDKVIKIYTGDILTTMLELIEGSTHVKFIKKAYTDLSDYAQKAFLYTSLLYRFQILMPASVLNNLVCRDWEIFINEVIKYDSKGILLNDQVPTSGNQPDLFFITRHSVISEILVKTYLKNEDARFKEYNRVLLSFIDSDYNCSLAVDILKALRYYDDFSQAKLNKLYDNCASIFSNNEHFIIHYSRNLQARKDENSLLKAERILSPICIETGNLFKRNKMAIHRLAVVYYELARIYHKSKSSEANHYIENAIDSFEIKRTIDPLSAFSYRDYIRFKMWCLKELNQDDEEQIQTQMQIEELIDEAERYVDDIEWIVEEKENYNRKYKYVDKKNIDDYIDELVDRINSNSANRPYLLVLLFYQLYEKEDCEKDEIDDIIIELENSYSHLNFAAKLLFKYYGRNLYLVKNRSKLYGIIQKHDFLKIQNRLRFLYYKIIISAYNRYWNEYYALIRKMRESFTYLNPEINEPWKETNGDIQLFVGTLKKNTKGRRQVRVLDLSKNFYLEKGTSSKHELNQVYFVQLNFYLSGIRVKIIKKKE